MPDAAGSPRVLAPCERGQSRLLCDRLGFRRSLTRPDQYSPVLVHSQAFGVDQFILEIREIGIIQGELSLQSTIRDSPFMLEYGNDLGSTS